MYINFLNHFITTEQVREAYKKWLKNIQQKLMKTSLFSISVKCKHSLFSKLLYPFVCRQFPPIKESSTAIIRMHWIQVTCQT